MIVSIWHSIETDDIEQDDEQKEFDIFLYSDDQGANYATLTFEQVKIMYEHTLKAGR